MDLVPAPASAIRNGAPPLKRGPHPNTYLWAITTDAVPFIMENAVVQPALQAGRIVHTNLTGGAEAHCAGELWFSANNAFWMSGGSSRYQARSKEELDAVTSAFVQCGFDVVSLGWDDDIDGPARVYRGTQNG